MFTLNDIKEENKVPRIMDLAHNHNQKFLCSYNTHPVVNKEILPRVSGHPRISPLEADLMDLMGDALGG